MRKLSLVLPAAVLLASACLLEKSDTESDDGDTDDTIEEGKVEPDAGKPGRDASKPHADAGKPHGDASAPKGDAAAPSDDKLVWTTEELTVEPGQERYLCFTKEVDEDVVIDAYDSEGQPFLHHLIFSRAKAPEPDGFAECDIAFKGSWEPLFITGAGPAELTFPSDAGHKIAKGTQLVAQMHLLNVGDEPVKGKVSINMHRSANKDPRPVSNYVFGTAAVSLPAKKKTDVVGTCKSREKVQLLAGFPHMHLLGTALKFEVGPTESTLKTVFERKPYSFHTQSIEPVEVEIAPGDVTRVTCSFNNTLAQDVTYGESTKNEMCYFVGFAIDRPTQGGCLEVLPPLTGH